MLCCSRRSAAPMLWSHDCTWFWNFNLFNIIYDDFGILSINYLPKRKKIQHPGSCTATAGRRRHCHYWVTWLDLAFLIKFEFFIDFAPNTCKKRKWKRKNKKLGARARPVSVAVTVTAICESYDLFFFKKFLFSKGQRVCVIAKFTGTTCKKKHISSAAVHRLAPPLSPLLSPNHMTYFPLIFSSSFQWLVQ